MIEVETFTLPITREQFCIEVQSLVSTKEMPWLDAVTMVCEKHQIEFEDVAPLIDAKTKMELESEFRQMNYLPRISQLPL